MTKITAGYSGKSVTEKFGIKENISIRLINEPKDFIKIISPLPESVAIKRTLGLSKIKSDHKTDMIICFVYAEKEVREIIPVLDHLLNDKGMVWMCWAKKTSKLFSGVTEDMIRTTAITQTKLVDVKVCAVSEDYSGLKLVKRVK